MRRLRLALLLLVILVVAGAAYGAYLYQIAGEWKTLKPHFAGACRGVSGVVGAEDITIHPQGRVAFISADDRRAAAEGRVRPGAIYAYDLTAVAPAPVNLTPDADSDFRPHGISLFVAPDGAVRLFVVNHAGQLDLGSDATHSIEIFDLEGDRLRHRASLRSPLLVSPNDIVAADRDRFYVTNDHGASSRLARLAEDYLLLPWGFVVYYDGSAFHKAAGGITYANGINLSPAGDRLYVASPTMRKLLIYDRDPATGALDGRREVFVGTGIDNIEVDPAGTLWIGAHPKLLTFVAHARDGDKLAPSQVLRLTPGVDEGVAIEEIFLSDGADMSGSSVAARAGDRLLIGPVMDSRFLDCRMR